MAQTQVEGNTCHCLNITCGQFADGPCPYAECKTCKSCCSRGCEGCKVKCKANEPCKCYILFCGCLKDCYKDSTGKGNCKGKDGSCKRCERRCTEGMPCKCYFCTCGTHCNGVICSCCKWCDPKNCSGEECNGFVIGRCPDPGPCRGHVKYDNYDNDDNYNTYGAVYNRETTNVIKCDEKPHPGKACTENNCNWLRGERDMNGNCVIKCTYCGKLCGQDNFRRCCYIAVPLFITVSAFLIFRFMVPEKFHAITTKIRAAFPSAPRHPGRSLSNLVGNRLPEEMSVDRYPAFRPKAFAGLS